MGVAAVVSLAAEWKKINVELVMSGGGAEKEVKKEGEECSVDHV